ncbi:MAG: hypothetical protein CM15mP18_5240 [Methanobacteriota archaeon]|nr:MAG: hypothetical protein CM15mP18_5240 [Euryarchaeota archaeon]
MTTSRYAEATCTNEEGEESWSLYVVNQRSTFELPNGDTLVLTDLVRRTATQSPGAQTTPFRLAKTWSCWCSSTETGRRSAWGWRSW